ncbi:hypothetical protein [Virgibacillus pantothenticus]|uniref:hypothetical protein n=1 Tax=Virgibacillus pantothenticus TaxID=1473 RepID=UPI00147D5D6C|nr:hypothetical protein [Virgibacillus pantothenticus]
MFNREDNRVNHFSFPLFSMGAEGSLGGITWSGGHDSISMREPISLSYWRLGS